MMLLSLAMLVALGVDRLFGEPPAWAHPVVGIGRYLGLFGQRLCALKPLPAFLGGALAWLLGAVACVSIAWGLETALILNIKPWRGWLELLLCAVLLGLLFKPLLAWRMLREEVAAVEAALQQSLAAGQQQLARLVSRDTTVLTETEVRETALETLAENLNDSVVAPLFWFMLAGLPGAALYRFANTADAMWGYRGRWEWAGKWAARADDALSFIPARLTALALLAPRLWLLPQAWREARRTPSPNGGWPMGALALRLDRRLGKPGVYVLNPAGHAVEAADGKRAQSLASQALWGCVLLLAGLAAWLRMP